MDELQAEINDLERLENLTETELETLKSLYAAQDVLLRREEELILRNMDNSTEDDLVGDLPVPQTTKRRSPRRRRPSSYVVGGVREASVAVVDDVREVARQRQTPMQNPTVSDALAASASILGEAMFVMVRDWLDSSSAAEHVVELTADDLEAFRAEEALALSGNRRAPLGESEDVDDVVMAEDEVQRRTLARRNSMKSLARSMSVKDLVTDYRDAGNTTEAINLTRKRLETRVALYGEDSKAAAHCYNQLGALHVETEDGEQVAEKYFEKALKALEAATSHSAAPSNKEKYVLNNLATCKAALGKRAEADQLVSRALACCDRDDDARYRRVLSKRFPHVV